MTLGGWVLLGLAWGSILYLTVWCIARVLSGESRDGTRDEEGPPPVVPTA